MVCGNGDGWREARVSHGDGIEAALGKGMASGEAAECQPGAFEDAETDQGNVRVLGAGGKVEALGGAEGMKDRRQHGLVEPVCPADREAGLEISHCVKRHEVV
jgi:hypothetical protein